MNPRISLLTAGRVLRQLRGDHRTVAMLRRVIGEHIALDLQLTSDLPLVYADSTSVDQIVMNLALNARDAMNEGGNLTISSSVVEIDEAYQTHTHDAQLGRFIGA